MWLAAPACYHHDMNPTHSSPQGPTKAEQKRIRELHARKGRREHNAFLVEGGKSVAELLASDWPVLAVYATPAAAPGLREAAGRRGLRLVEVGAGLLTSLGTYEHNDSAIAISGLRQRPLQPLRAGELTLALDDIRDPGNLGTILRLADWYGVTQVVCSATTADWQNPKVIAASMGSFLRVGIHEVDLPAWLAAQRATGAAIAGAVLDGESTHALAAPFSDGVLVIGNESHGLSDAAQAQLTRRLTIPRFGAAESLNAAVATGILLDAWRREGRA